MVPMASPPTPEVETGSVGGSLRVTLSTGRGPSEVQAGCYGTFRLERVRLARLVGSAIRRGRTAGKEMVGRCWSS
jgi:hypothetical protein